MRLFVALFCGIQSSTNLPKISTLEVVGVLGLLLELYNVF